MFKIGEFSSLTRVSVKTLRWYDEIGLLKPARVDPDTGYRYYLARQIGQLARILLLKNLGFSLDQVRVMLDGYISDVQIRNMLQALRSQLADQLQQEQERLTMVEGWLNQVENEGGELMSAKSDLPSLFITRRSIANVTWTLRLLFRWHPAAGWQRANCLQ